MRHELRDHVMSQARAIYDSMAEKELPFVVNTEFGGVEFFAVIHPDGMPITFASRQKKDVPDFLAGIHRKLAGQIAAGAGEPLTMRWQRVEVARGIRGNIRSIREMRHIL